MRVIYYIGLGSGAEEDEMILTFFEKMKKAKAGTATALNLKKRYEQFFCFVFVLFLVLGEFSLVSFKN
jgi:hypothetical protein